jgi:hypothetical protein
MTMLRIIAITAVVCAATGMTTQAEAAKRKIPPGSIQLQGCAYWMPLCGTVMEHPDYSVRPEDGQSQFVLGPGYAGGSNGLRAQSKNKLPVSLNFMRP